ncbi:DUF6056 family protein [Enterobacter hormaechei subsp. steigerwaltii]|uniref:DUF3329 domain-containing protein n=1 Tax=Enterobacter hormaechei TaxID=158836 RepID=UPI00222FA2A7|nr:DUF6056 family protein [Enterobacter hormaechei]MDM9326534.1 DUF6056 family protein [Enterobacter hormaechei subsp. steigerwaltii]
MASKFVRDNLLSIIVLVSAFILVLIMNNMTMYVADDFVYRFVYQTNPSPDAVPIDGIYSIIESQIRHYEIWNGRFVAHSLVQFFMQFDKAIFNIFNSIAFVMIGVLVIMVANSISAIKDINFSFVIAFMLLWLIIPEFGSSVLWVSGSMNYLWMSLIYTAFILISIRAERPRAVYLTIYLVLGFLTGATNENSGPASALIVIMVVVYDYVTYRKVSLWKASGVVFAIAGFLLMITSPGSQKRGGNNFSLNVLADHFVNILHSSISLFFFFYVALAFLVAFCIYKKTVTKRDVAFTLIFLTGHFASIYSMVAAPSFPERTAFGASIMLLILLVHYICKIPVSSLYSKAFVFVLYTASIITYTYAFTDIHSTYKQLRAQQDVIENAQMGTDVSVPMITKPKSDANAYKNTIYLTHRKNSWMNMWAARFYNLNSISGKD